MIPRLVLASKNPDKLAELESVLSGSGLYRELVASLEWPEVDEVGETLEDNALLKAVAVVEATGLPAISDDTGLEVDALDGAPGVHARRFAGPDASYEDNVRLLLSRMDGVTGRSARFRTVVALAFPDGASITAEGVLEGVITTERRGQGGFGYDPVFEVDGRTLGEMGEDEKNRISHRGLALMALLGDLGLGER